jgi:hypothetical protein
MDWNSILIDALSVTSILSIIGLIRFWKQNKKLKNNEVKKDDVETQKAEIDLANLYKEEMLKVIELLKSSQSESNENQEKIINKLENMDTRLGNVEIKMDGIETYLNGPYHEWLASQGK